MGGFGSGRTGGQPTAESTRSLVLTLKSLKLSRFKPGDVLGGKLVFNDSGFSIDLKIHLTEPAGAYIEFSHETRDWQEGKRRVEYNVRLVWTVPNYGGRRWWFVCPRTGRKNTKLFLPNGGWQFWSREAYRLGYACQREKGFDRHQSRAMKLSADLRAPSWCNWSDPPPKPKWMRWKTYDRKFEEWETAVELANRAFVIQSMPMLKRLGRL